MVLVLVMTRVLLSQLFKTSLFMHSGILAFVLMSTGVLAHLALTRLQQQAQSQ